MFRGRLLFAIVLVALLLTPLAQMASAGQVLDVSEYTYRTWARTDLPVAEGIEARTWMWGPEAFATARREEYTEAPGGDRYVEYYDKARMEVTNPNGDTSSIWYVTNGLLVVELISGRMQVGNNSFIERYPAQVNVAGDADDDRGPTYATLASVLDASPTTVGSVITQRIDRNGQISNDPSLATWQVTADVLDPVTNHTIAHKFWVFMNATGMIYENGEYVFGRLSPDAYFATGRPITEAYWAEIKVGGVYKDVLMQCFERRCLTYTPTNPGAWQVEAGNVGRHYHTWRYSEASPDNIPEVGELLYSSALTDWPAATGANGESFIADDTYHLRANPDGMLLRYLDTGDSPLTDTRVSLDLRLLSGQSPDAHACLMTRLDPISLRHAYSFCLTGDGRTYAIYEVFDPTTVEPLVSVGERTIAADEWTTISIIARGESFWFLVNDQLVGTVSHTGPPGGYPGFYLLNGSSAPAEFEFTNLRIWEVQ